VKELFELSFAPVNAFLSIMCIVMLLYWLLVIFAGLDPDFFSIEFDGAPEADADLSTIEMDPAGDRSGDTDADGEGFFNDILRFFHFDELPLMFILTLVFFTMWFFSINITHYLGISSPLIGVLLYIPYFIVSLFVVKIFSKPLIYLYRQLNHKGEEAIDFLGRRCMVVSRVEKDKMGTVELLVKGDPIKIYAKSNTNEVLMAGTEAVIVNESKDKKYYLIEKFDY
jgi:membrane protein implicated in regulation of membrane protease activity